MNVDNTIHNTTFLADQTSKPGRSNKFNINSTLVFYAIAIQHEDSPEIIQYDSTPINA